jgi:glycosyltransferase 2 family protein
VKPSSIGLWRNVRRWLPGAIISLIAFITVFRLARWEDLKLAFTTIQPLYLLLAVVISVVSLGTRAMAWRVLLKNRATFKQSFFIICEGYFLNYILPLRAGEIGRAVFMGETSGLGPFHVLSTIVIERAFDLVMASGLLLATLPMVLGVSWARPVAILTMLLVIIGLVVLYLAARNSQKVHGWVSSLGKRLPLVQKWIVPSLDSLLEGLGTLTRLDQFLLALFWIFMSWVLWVLLYFVMLQPVSPGFPLYRSMFMTGVLALGLAIPQAPGGLGVFEASVVGTLAIFGISPSAALAYALLMHFMQFVIDGIFGFIELIRSRNSISNLFEQIQMRNNVGQ